MATYKVDTSKVDAVAKSLEKAAQDGLTRNEIRKAVENATGEKNLKMSELHKWEKAIDKEHRKDGVERKPAANNVVSNNINNEITAITTATTYERTTTETVEQYETRVNEFEEAQARCAAILHQIDNLLASTDMTAAEKLNKVSGLQLQYSQSREILNKHNDESYTLAGGKSTDGQKSLFGVLGIGNTRASMEAASAAYAKSQGEGASYVSMADINNWTKDFEKGLAERDNTIMESLKKHSDLEEQYTHGVITLAQAEVLMMMRNRVPTEYIIPAMRANGVDISAIPADEIDEYSKYHTGLKDQLNALDTVVSAAGVAASDVTVSTPGDPASWIEGVYGDGGPRSGGWNEGACTMGVMAGKQYTIVPDGSASSGIEGTITEGEVDALVFLAMHEANRIDANNPDGQVAAIMSAALNRYDKSDNFGTTYYNGFMKWAADTTGYDYGVSVLNGDYTVPTNLHGSELDMNRFNEVKDIAYTLLGGVRTTTADSWCSSSSDGYLHNHFYEAAKYDWSEGANYQFLG